MAIENVLRRATRLLTKISHLSYKDRLIYLGLPSLEYRRRRAEMLQVFKILHNYDRVSTKDLLKLSNYSRTRGHNLKLQKQTVKSKIRKNSFSIRVVDTWNNLPYDVVNADCVNSLKDKLNIYWKTHPSKFEPQCYTSTTANKYLDKQMDFKKSKTYQWSGKRKYACSRDFTQVINTICQHDHIGQYVLFMSV